MSGTGGMHRSAGLDALRAAACALVVVFHLHTVAGVSFGPADPFVSGGDVGVYIFFALSGYLLYRPFVDREVDLTTYGIKRAARILPGYYVALIALTLLTGSRLATANPVPYLAIASSYSLPLRGFLGSAWTLSAELLFYVALPLVARLARGREIGVLSLLGLVSIAITIALRTTPTEGNLLLLASFPAVGYAFIPGMLLAVLELRYPAAFRHLAAWPYAVLGVALILLGLLTHTSPLAIGPGIGTPLLMAWLLQHRVPYAGPLAFAGGASYAMYLWHKDVLLAFGAPGLLIALAGSAASWAIVERPILNWAHSISRGRAGRRTSATPA